MLWTHRKLSRLNPHQIFHFPCLPRIPENPPMEKDEPWNRSVASHEFAARCGDASHRSIGFWDDRDQRRHETGLPWRTTTAKLESGGRRAADDVVSMPKQAPPVGPLTGVWCGTWVEAEVLAGCPMQVNI